MPPVNRRTFSATSLALAGSVLSGQRSLMAGDRDSGEPLRMVRLGLNALSRAADRQYFADGHRGAAMISAHLMCVGNQFDETAVDRISELFDLNWASSKLCAPFPEADPVQDAAHRVGAALAEGGTVLREVGHDAIFAMHAIKAFEMLPELATPDRVDGVCRLIRAFKPWKDIPPDDSVKVPPFSDSKAASRFILTEALQAVDRFVGFGQGFAGHMLTFGQSLVALADIGHEEWAEGCRTAFRKYVTVTRKGPQPGDRRIKDHQVTMIRPENTEYWKRRGDRTLGLGHVFKYPYAYYDLMKRAEDPNLKRQWEEKAWHIF